MSARRTEPQDPDTCTLVRILGESVRPGEHRTLDLQVAKLYTRTSVEIPVVVLGTSCEDEFEYADPGPDDYRIGSIYLLEV